MTIKNNRRSILKLVAGGTMVGFVDTVTADENPRQTHRSNTDVPDLLIRNNKEKAVKLTMKFYRSTDNYEKINTSPEKYQVYDLGPSETSSSVSQHSLNIPSGMYILEVNTGLEETPSTSTHLGVSPEGLPNWSGIEVRTMPKRGPVIDMVEV